MSTKHPLPGDYRPSASQVMSYLEAAALGLERSYVQVNAAVMAARLWATQRGDTPPEDMLAALRSFHQHCRAMQLPASSALEDVLAGALWAEGVSWDALGVPLVDTEHAGSHPGSPGCEPTPAAIAEAVDAWLGNYTPGVQ